MDNPSDDRKTRILEIPDGELAQAPLRATTGPLSEELPWVLEFRVVGTPATVQAQVHEAMIIGRSDPLSGSFPDVDLNPHGAQVNGVSRRHAAIIAKDNRIKVKDLGSVNGTRLNGFLLKPQEEYRLRHDDELQVGQLKLQVRFAVVPTIEAKSSPESGKENHATLPILGHGEQVLIVEDDPDVGKVFKIALEHTGFKVNVADTAERALGSIAHQRPDVIVLDLMLPDMNGLDLVKIVRKQGHTMPMIVCSGIAGDFQEIKAKEAGAETFLGKPVSVDTLVRAIELGG